MGTDRSDLEPLLQRGFRYALALAHDRERARDLLQDACVRVARHGGPWAVGYLFRAVRSAWIDRARSERLRPFDAASGNAALDFDEASGARPRALAPALPDEALHSALARLGGDERELLYLAVVEGHTASELARQCGSPRGTVLSRLHRAKQKLRDLLSARRSEVDA